MRNLILLAVTLILMLTACSNYKNNTILKQSDFPAPPIAEVKADTFLEFNKQRIDNYFWMKEKDNPKIIEYLNAENAYTDAVMSSTQSLQQKIYEEILGRIKEDDESYPSYKNGYFYYVRNESGKQYPTFCRKKESLSATEEVIFDVNLMAENRAAFIFAGYYISPDNNKAAYFYNETGSYAEYIMKIKDLSSGNDIGFSVEGVTSMAWANDNKTLFFSVINDTLRSYQIRKQQLDKKESELIYEESDANFSTFVTNDKNQDYIFIINSSYTTSEERFIEANNPTSEFKILKTREKDAMYEVYPHKEYFFVQYRDKSNLNGMVYKVPLKGYEDKENWEVFLSHDPSTQIEELDVLKDYVIIEMKRNGLAEIEVKPIKEGPSQFIKFPEPVYTASLEGNPEYDATTFRYTYTSLNRPTTIYEYDIKDLSTQILKEQEIPAGFNPDNYAVERLWATSHDGIKVPMAIVYKKDLKRNGTNPAIIYAYGSYGISSDVHFSTSYYSLIDRGFVFAIAQIRGGSDMGEQWYEEGKLLKKKNTFSDFIACSEKLIADGYTSASKLNAIGGSAGGLLMGAMSNMRPELFHSIIAQVPFVDVVTTLFDETLPLTVGDYEEWGNPNDEEYFNYILSYSPYDNVKAQDYPNMLITGGINDSQVLYHEPTKWVAKLRAMKTDDNIVLLHMDMDSGHGGATGRYNRIKDVAFEFAFILSRLGIDN